MGCATHWTLDHFSAHIHTWEWLYLYSILLLSQALDVIKQLRETNTMSIQKAEMRIRVTIPAREAKKVKEKIRKLAARVEEEDFSSDLEMVCCGA